MVAASRHLSDILVGGMSNHCRGQDLIAGHLNSRVHVGVCTRAVQLGLGQGIRLILDAVRDVWIYNLNCIHHSTAGRPATTASSRSGESKGRLLPTAMLAGTVRRLQQHCCGEMPTLKQSSERTSSRDLLLSIGKQEGLQA